MQGGFIMTEQFLHGFELVEIDDGIRSIRTVKTSVIGLVGTAPEGPVNTPVLIAGSRREAVNQFGAHDGIHTIPWALDAIFDQAGAMVVVVRVADTESVSGEEVTRGSVAIDALDNSPVKDISRVYMGETEYIKDTDFQKAETGVEWLDGGNSPSENDVYSVDYEYYLGDAAVATNIIGGTNEVNGNYEGVHALLAARSELALTPRLLIAPGFTDQQAVVTEMLPIAETLKGVVIADGPSTTDSAALAYREVFGSERLYLIDPRCKVWDTLAAGYSFQESSARVAGLIAKSDNDRGFWWSPSNQEIGGIVGTERPVSFAFNDPNTRANYLNENEVATIVCQEGYRLWGNRTCSADPKWAFLSVRRTADMINESLMMVHLWAVDRNITRSYVEEVSEGVNAYLRHLIAVGAIVGGKCYVDPELNTPDQIQDGKVYFDFEFTPPYPAEHITFRSHLINDYLVEVIS